MTLFVKTGELRKKKIRQRKKYKN